MERGTFGNPEQFKTLYAIYDELDKIDKFKAKKIIKIIEIYNRHLKHLNDIINVGIRSHYLLICKEEALEKLNLIKNDYSHNLIDHVVGFIMSKCKHELKKTNNYQLNKNGI